MFRFIVLEIRIEYAHLVILERAPLCLCVTVRLPSSNISFLVFLFNNNITSCVLCFDGGFSALQVMNSSGSEFICGIFHV